MRTLQEITDLLTELDFRIADELEVWPGSIK